MLSGNYLADTDHAQREMQLWKNSRSMDEILAMPIPFSRKR